MLGLLVVNIVVSFSLFLSIMGLVFYGLKTLEIRKNSKNYYNVTYFSYFLWMFIFYTGNFLGYNWISLFGENSSFLFFDLLTLIKAVNIAAIITFFFLAIALRLESGLTASQRMIWGFLVFLGIVALLSYLVTNIYVVEIQNNIPLIGYNPDWVVNVSTLFALFTGIWYGLQTLTSYRSNYQEKYGISTYHYFFLAISFLTFLGLILAIGCRFLLPDISEVRALVFTVTMLCLAIFPTLRWTYIQRFEQRKMEFERNTLIDIINHDLSNINHIILAILETAKTKGTALSEDDIRLLLTQIARMSSLIEESRSSIRTGPVDLL